MKTFEDGVNYLTGYLLRGDPPPLAWCPIDDVRFIDVMVWGNVLIFVAYQIIPIAILRIKPLVEVIPNRRLYVAFGLFISLCGVAHLLMVWAMFSGMYELLAVWGMLTGVVSIWVAGELWALGSALNGNGPKGNRTASRG